MGWKMQRFDLKGGLPRQLILLARIESNQFFPVNLSIDTEIVHELKSELVDYLRASRSLHFYFF